MYDFSPLGEVGDYRKRAWLIAIGFLDEKKSTLQIAKSVTNHFPLAQLIQEDKIDTQPINSLLTWYNKWFLQDAKNISYVGFLISIHFWALGRAWDKLSSN